MNLAELIVVIATTLVLGVAVIDLAYWNVKKNTEIQRLERENANLKAMVKQLENVSEIRVFNPKPIKAGLKDER